MEARIQKGRTSAVRPGFTLCWLLILAAVQSLAAPAAMAAPPSASAQDVLQFLGQTVDWYRRVTSFDRAPVNAEEVLFRDTVKQNALQVLRLGFQFARAEALLVNGNSANSSTSPASRPTTGKSNGSNVAQTAALAAQRVVQFQSQLDELNRQAEKGSTPVLIAKRDKVAAELALATARREALQSFVKFSSDIGSTEGLLQKIKDLESTVPGAAAEEQPSSPSSVAVSSEASGPALSTGSLGIIGLMGEIFSLTHRMGEISDLAAQTDILRTVNDKFRQPLRSQIIDAVHRADALYQAGDPDDVEALGGQRQQIEDLSGRYKAIASAVVPIGEQNISLDTARANLLEWRDALARDYVAVVRYLILRLGGVATGILIVLGVSKLWRKAVFRYITDIRRRRQFLLIRRLIVTGLILVILIAGLVTQFGSLATFAGLITAGVAVALQTVILSGVAHFFVLGRYGVRVGDRVTVAGITGDVIDIGIFRLYLMELAGTGVSFQPTGRIVVFSNSVLFQPSAFFKQIPGADYAWHEVAMTLSPESDYRLAETRLLSTVESVYDEYRQGMETQFAQAQNAIHLQLPPPKAEARLRFVESGLEIVIRYPVELRRAAQIDDVVTRKLLETIANEPKLRMVASGTPRLQAGPSDKAA